MIKTYSPDDILKFGIYKGECMRFIFTFDPKYVEYLITHLDHFYIDITNYSHLHTQPLEKTTTEAWFGFHYADHEPYSLKEYLSEYTNLLELHYYNPPSEKNLFKFNEEVLVALSKKEQLLKEWHETQA